VTEDGPIRWRAAMTTALYGEGGFYAASGAPSRHFRTSAQAAAQWTAAIGALASHVDAATGEAADFAVVDVGAGGGELLAGLSATAPPRWSLIGVDIAPRPAGLPDRVAWRREAPDSIRGLLVANELLDVVPLDVAELDADGPHLIEVSLDGTEHRDGPPSQEDMAWLRRWWPLASPGDRAEIGLPRDLFWRQLTAGVDLGVALAIDYAADPEQDVAGTLTGYRDGRQVLPTPDGSCDLTAHVMFESLRDDDDLLMSQRDALRALGVRAARPDYDGDPRAYLAALSAAGEAAELIDPSGLGSFSWLIHQVGVDIRPVFG
jgi:SAM-dependent MidA family methyltransferase